MKEYQIYPLHLGTINRECSNMIYRTNPGKKVDFPLVAYLVTDGENKILFDTGAFVPEGGFVPPGKPNGPYIQEPDQRIDRALGKIGVSCDEIKTVVLSHLHWDHAGSCHFFKNAKFIVQKTEYNYALHPIKIHQFPYRKAEFEDLNFEFVDGDVEIGDGLKLILTPGHTPGSQTLLVNTSDGTYALVADLVNTRECWESDPKLANGYHTDLIVHYQSFEKVAAITNNILEGHEIAVFEHECYPYTK